MNKDLVIFDFDGVIADSEYLDTVAWVQFVREVFNISADKFSDGEIMQIAGGGLDEKIFERAKEIDNNIVVPFDFKSIHHKLKKEVYAKQLKKIDKIDVLFDKLTENNIKFCIASSDSIDSLKYKLKLTNLSEYFDNNIFSADMVAKGKPAPDLFLFACKKMNSTPEASIVVEDAIHGINAGISANMDVVGFVGGTHAKSQEYQDKIKTTKAKIVTSNILDVLNLI